VACLIQVNVINTHSPLFFFLLDKYKIGNPLRVNIFSNKLEIYELINLLLDNFLHVL
jgi:hypothetical protein